MTILWLVLAVLLWGCLHSLLASIRVRQLFTRRFGIPSDRWYRLAYNLFACISFFPVLAISTWTPDRILYIIPFPWALLALLGELLAVIALVAGFRQSDPLTFLGLRQLTSPAKAPSKLVVGGLYRYVRHPLYSAGLVFIWLLPLMTVNTLAICSALTVYVLVGAYFEEKKLLLEFGESYSAYQQQTPMLVPRLPLHRNK